MIIKTNMDNVENIHVQFVGEKNKPYNKNH